MSLFALAVFGLGFFLFSDCYRVAHVAPVQFLWPLDIGRSLHHIFILGVLGLAVNLDPP
jgi:hypothetical protein